jgi:hypothetical protein
MGKLICLDSKADQMADTVLRLFTRSSPEVIPYVTHSARKISRKNMHIEGFEFHCFETQDATQTNLLKSRLTNIYFWYQKKLFCS